MEQVALEANNSPRTEFLSYSDQEFREYVKSKFSKEDLITIWQNYVLSNTPQKPANKIRHQSADDLIRTYLDNNGSEKFLTEQKIRRSYCDLVLYDENSFKTKAIEVKSNGDDFRKAERQANKYSKWANSVAFLVESRKTENALKRTPEWTGLYEISDGDLKEVRSPKDLNHQVEELLDLMTVPQLKKIISTLGKDPKGKRADLLEKCKSSAESIDKSEARRVLLFD